MTSALNLLAHGFLCFALVWLAGFTSLFSRPEDPQKVVNGFVNAFLAGDSGGMFNMVHPDVQAEKEIKVTDVERFLKACKSNSMSLESAAVDKRFKSEDKTAERFESSLVFRGPALADQYPGASRLKMVLIWVLEDGKWWLERPVSIEFVVNSAASYPTSAQEELALRFDTALSVLESIGLPGSDDLFLVGQRVQGSALETYKQLEKLYAKERSLQGIDANAEGIQLLLKASDYSTGGFLRVYHPDFKIDPADPRKPVPWDMYRDYVTAAMKYGKQLEQRRNPKAAEKVYRRIVSLGRQFLDESGGYSFFVWGLTFQKLGAQELLRLTPSSSGQDHQRIKDFISVTSRRLDLLQTALNCLDDLADYNSLMAAAKAVQAKNTMFRLWGINTLSILALKGAPAHAAVAKATGSLVVVINPVMKKKAGDALSAISATSSEDIRSFVERQKQWVLNHNVYGTAQAF